jgi:glycosyltransferase involved in cell wall biosynthesis
MMLLDRRDWRRIRLRPARDVDLVVVVNGFPRLSETFVLQELLDLEQRGVRLHLVALLRPDEPVEQAGVAALRAPVEYLPEVARAQRRLLARTAHAALFLHRGARYLNAISDVVLAPDYSRRRLAQAAFLAHRIARLGFPPVYIHFAHKPATVGRFAARLAGVPYALSAHAKDVWLTPSQELATKVREATMVLTCTAEGRSRLEALGGGATPVRLIHHGVDIVPREPHHASDGPPVVLSVGRLVPKKGHATLVRAAGLLAERGVPFTLRIAGEGEEWPRLQRLVYEQRLDDRVLFLGPLGQAEVSDEYARADVFALPCRQLPNGDRDGIPNVILEAMVQGLPVVSTKLAGVAEAVDHDESGLLVAQDDEHALAQALQRLLSDAGLRARLGAAGRGRVSEHFDRARHLPAVHAALVEAGIVLARSDGGVAPGASAARARAEVS